MSRHLDPLSIYSEAVPSAAHHQGCLFLFCALLLLLALFIRGSLIAIDMDVTTRKPIPMSSLLLPHLDNSPRGLE